METYDLCSLIHAILLPFTACFYYLRNRFSYFDFFERNNVAYVKPILVFGNVKDWILMRRPLAMIYYDIYTRLEPHPFGGMYVGIQKNILIRDPRLIEDILVKDFSYFEDRQRGSSRSDLLSKSLLRMSGQEWRNLRRKLINTFTLEKIKRMLPLIRNFGEKLNLVLQDMSIMQDDIEIDIKDICSRFTIDAIGSCFFSLETNALENPNSVYRKMADKIFETSFTKTLASLIPKYHHFFDRFGNNEEITKFFLNLVRENVEYRKQHNLVQDDFLDLLINLENGTDSDVTMELIAAQYFLFYGAGYETTSSTLCFMVLELAQNHQIQEKLRDEIIRVLENNNSELTYAALQQMKYLEMVIEETLRKYPTVGRIIRVCNKPYKIPGAEFVIPEGMTVIVPLRGLHYDSKFFENPDEFYPGHFTEEAKASRSHYSYLPFGAGPRVCMGGRFAKMLIKIGAVNLFRNFSYYLSPKLQLPVEYSPGIGVMNIKGGFWLKCRRLRNTNV